MIQLPYGKRILSNIIFSYLYILAITDDRAKFKNELYRDHALDNNNQFHPDLRGIPRFRVYLGTRSDWLGGQPRELTCSLETISKSQLFQGARPLSEVCLSLLVLPNKVPQNI